MITGTRYQMRMEVNRQMKLAEEIARAQTEISSRKRILAPSDDPVASARISDIARAQADQATWKTNLTRAAALSASADTALEGIANALDRASELMMNAASGTASPENRNAIAIELESIGQEIAALRQTRDSRGELVFPEGTPIAIPVGQGIQVAPVATRASVFDVDAGSGATSVEAIIAAATAAVRANDTSAMASGLDQVGRAVKHVTAAHGEQGARGARIDALLERIENTKLGLTEERSALEDADIVELVARLQSRELSLEAAQAAFARIHQSNLFDLLR